MQICYTVFKQANLFNTFKINYQKFFNFTHALERGYWDIPCEFLFLFQLILLSRKNGVCNEFLLTVESIGA